MVFGFNTRPAAGQPVQPPTRSVAPTEMQQSTGFTDVLKAPEVQAALIQFGINMMNPTYDGFGGQLGRSLGAAGAAAGRASGQKMEREEAARKARREDAELGLVERRVATGEKQEERLNRFGPKGLTSMFSKGKPFQQFLVEQAEKDYLGTDYDTPSQLSNDPNYYQQTLDLWKRTSAVGMEGGGVSGGGQLGAEEAKAAARAAIAKGAPEDAVRQRLQDQWGVTLE